MGTVMFGYGQVTAESTVPVAVADGAEVIPWFDTLGRQVNKFTNIATNAADVNEIAPWGTQRLETAFTQLTAVGSTAGTNSLVYHNGCFQYIVAAINANVVVRAEGSLDNTNWFNLAGADTTILANGTYALEWTNRALEYVRCTFVSEAGGAAATIDVTLMLGN